MGKEVTAKENTERRYDLIVFNIKLPAYSAPHDSRDMRQWLQLKKEFFLFAEVYLRQPLENTDRMHTSYV